MEGEYITVVIYPLLFSYGVYQWWGVAMLLFKFKERVFNPVKENMKSMLCGERDAWWYSSCTPSAVAVYSFAYVDAFITPYEQN